MSAEEPVRLIFDPSTKVAGQVIEGAVDLHWPTAIDKNIEEVILKLRGEINTYVERILSGAPLTCPFIQAIRAYAHPQRWWTHPIAPRDRIWLHQYHQARYRIMGA